MADKNMGYKNALSKKAASALAIGTVLIASQLDAHGNVIKDPEERKGSISSAAKADPLFSSMGKGADEIAMIGAEACMEYHREYGVYPDASVLSLAHTQLTNLFSSVDADAAGNDSLLSSLNTSAMSSEQGVAIRQNVAAIVLPSLLLNPMNDAITYLPNPKHYETEVYRIERIAASTFGGLKEGDVIDSLTTGKYSLMRQRHKTKEAPDGTLKKFTFTSESDVGQVLPFAKRSVRIFLDKKLVAKEMEGNGSLYAQNPSGVNVSGTIDYVNGVLSVTFNEPPEDGSVVSVRFDIDVEKNPSLIPKIDHEQKPYKFYPFQRTIAADASIMAQFKASIEMNVNLRSLNLSSMRHAVTDEKAKEQLVEMYWHAQEVIPFDATVPEGGSPLEYYEQFQAHLNKLSTKLLLDTKKSGLTGLYAGTQVSQFIKSLPSTMFEKTPNYKQTASIHYVGKLFGQFKIFEVPQEELMPADEYLGYAKSDDIGDCGFVSGDVVPPMVYSQEVSNALIKGDILWAIGYDEIHPYNGDKFFIKGKLLNYSQA